jgi:DnaJ-class molecular chaperone
MTEHLQSVIRWLFKKPCPTCDGSGYCCLYEGRDGEASVNDDCARCHTSGYVWRWK